MAHIIFAQKDGAHHVSELAAKVMTFAMGDSLHQLMTSQPQVQRFVEGDVGHLRQAKTHGF